MPSRDDFLRRVGVHAKESVMLDVIGHSMEPMIRHKDTILVDQSVKELRDGDIFLVGFGEELLVKRVQRTPRGWLLKSENRDFSDIVVEGPDLETFRVYGRVRWFGRGRLRLPLPAGKHPPHAYPGSQEEFPPPLCSPANLHISRNAARARLLGGTGRLPAQPSAGTPSFSAVAGIALWAQPPRAGPAPCQPIVAGATQGSHPPLPPPARPADLNAPP